MGYNKKIKIDLAFHVSRFTLYTLMLFFSAFLVLIGVSPVARAAEFKITTVKPTINSQQKVRIEVLMSSKGEAINALEGKIVWPKDYFDLVSTNEANSIVNFWLTKPILNEQGDLVFAGIIPGGYSESSGLLFSFILQAKKDGEVSLTIQDLKALISDGEGTSAKTAVIPLKLSIATTTPLLLDFPNPDNEKPENFKPEISSSADLFDGQYFMVFATQDKGSGLDYYAVIESDKPLEIRKINPALWVKSDSPYLLQDQTLASYIYVKVTDKNGNERLAEVRPIKPRHSFWPQLPQILFYGIIIALIILGGIVISRFKLNIMIRKK